MTKFTLSGLVRSGINLGGVNWYRDGLNDCKIVANRLGVDVELVVYAVAVFSPRVSVSRACRLAVSWVAEPDVKPSGCLGQVYATANRYKERGYLNGPKTEAFRKSILFGGKTDAICLDVHMARILNGGNQSTLYRKDNFDRISKQIRRLGYKFNLANAEVQAALWCGYIEHLGLSNDKRRLIPNDVLNV